MPTYLPLLEEMFENTAVTGQSSFVAGVDNLAPISVDSDDDKDGPEEIPVTPMSAGTPATSSRKRGSSTSSTARTPGKKSKSPMTREISHHVARSVEIGERHVEVLQQLGQAQLKANEEARNARKMRSVQVHKIAAELGISPDTDETMYKGVLNLVEFHDKLVDIFLDNDTTASARLFVIKQCAPGVDN